MRDAHVKTYVIDILAKAIKDSTKLSRQPEAQHPVDVCHTHTVSNTPPYLVFKS